MIAPRNIHPSKSLYAIGAAVMGVMINTEAKEVDPENVYKDFVAVYPVQISYSYFLYSLDWLFLAGLINLSEDKQKILKCF